MCCITQSGDICKQCDQTMATRRRSPLVAHTRSRGNCCQSLPLGMKRSQGGTPATAHVTSPFPPIVPSFKFGPYNLLMPICPRLSACVVQAPSQEPKSKLADGYIGNGFCWLLLICSPGMERENCQCVRVLAPSSSPSEGLCHFH